MSGGEAPGLSPLLTSMVTREQDAVMYVVADW